MTDTSIRSPWLLALACGLAGACGGGSSTTTDGGTDGTTDAGTNTYYVCPGDPGCSSTGAAAFEVGVGKRSITPTITETMTVDVDGDGLYDRADGDQYDDVNGNGKFDAVWIAGFDNARPAHDVHDDVEARVLAIRSGDKLFVLVTADLVGLFYDDVQRLRDAVADLGIDNLTVACSHDHEGPDTIGLWGIDEANSGVDPAYMTFLRAQMEAAVRDAVADLRPATVSYGRTVPGESATLGVANVVGDGRDPVIINPWLTVLGFDDASDGSVIATLVNWTAHAEYSESDNTSLTADYVHSLRDGIENGVNEGSTDVPGVGGMALFTNGAVGSQIGPHDLHTIGLDGTVWNGNEGIPRAMEIGRILAVGALRARAETTSPDDTMDLRWVRARIELQVENYGYHAMLLSGIFDRDLHGYDPTLPLDTGNFPWLWTEVSWIKLGRAQVFTVGGEPCPEEFLGGYDGSYTPTVPGTSDYVWPLVDPASPHQPDLANAPPPPYLYQRLDSSAEYPMTWGLTNDMLGYLIPTYDYILDPSNPYIDEAYGSYYEETNSIGPHGWPTIEQAYIDILARRP